MGKTVVRTSARELIMVTVMLLIATAAASLSPVPPKYQALC